MPPVRRPRRRVPRSHALLLLALASCALFADPAPVLSPPVILFEIDHFAGSPVSGPRAGQVDEEATRGARAVRVDVRAVFDADVDALAPVSDVARLIADPSTRSTLRATPSLAQGTRFGAIGALADVTPSIPLVELDGVASADLTARFELESSFVPPRSVQILVRAREPGRLEVALRSQAPGTDLAPAPASGLRALDGDAASTADIPRPPHRELVVLPEVTGDACAIALPPWMSRAPTRLVALVTLGTADDAGLSRALADARRASADADPTASTGRAYLDAIASAPDELRRRTALATLARTADATITHDVALSAPRVLVDAIVGDVLANGAPPALAALGWRLERATLARVAEWPSDDPWAPILSALLARHIGEVGRHASVVADLAQTSAGAAAFTTRVIDGNVLLLEDSSPAARVRAFDWLSSRDLAPPGYDPLAPREERRLALERWRADRVDTDPGTPDDASTSAPSAGVP